MEELSKILEDASAAIGHGYFRLSIDGGDSAYRERVYCYEFYHQMRVRWPMSTIYYLNGEVDKAAHPILRRLGIPLSKPDLLVHRPGYMSGNHAVIEVKASNASDSAIKKDLTTLSCFRTQVGYQRAIYIVYGHTANDTLVNKIQRLAVQIDNLAQIELWFHQGAGWPAVHHSTLRARSGISCVSRR